MTARATLNWLAPAAWLLLTVTIPVAPIVAKSFVPGATPPQEFQSPGSAQLPVVVFQVQFAACARGAAANNAAATSVCIPTERDRGFRRMMTAGSDDVDR